MSHFRRPPLLGTWAVLALAFGAAACTAGVKPTLTPNDGGGMTSPRR